MIDLEQPKNISLVAMLASFILFTCLLYLFQPSCVEVINKDTGQPEIYWRMLFSYSLLCSLVISIICLIYFSKKRGEVQITFFDDVDKSAPTVAMAMNYNK